MLSVPTLDEIARDPQRCTDLDRAILAALALRASAVAGTIAAAVLAQSETAETKPSTAINEDRMLTPTEAAALLRK